MAQVCVFLTTRTQGICDTQGGYLYITMCTNCTYCTVHIVVHLEYITVLYKVYLEKTQLLAICMAGKIQECFVEPMTQR